MHSRWKNQYKKYLAGWLVVGAATFQGCPFDPAQVESAATASVENFLNSIFSSAILDTLATFFDVEDEANPAPTTASPP